jgi:hypothetical protein
MFPGTVWHPACGWGCFCSVSCRPCRNTRPHPAKHDRGREGPAHPQTPKHVGAGHARDSLNVPPIRGHGPLLHHMTTFQNPGMGNPRAAPAKTTRTHTPPKHVGTGHARDSLNVPPIRGHGPLLHHMTISENRGIVDSRAWPAPTSYDHLRKPGFGRFAGHAPEKHHLPPLRKHTHKPQNT